MKQVMSFLSMLAVGVMAAVVFASGVYGPVDLSQAGAAAAGAQSEKFRIDFGSLLLGLALGVLIGNLSAIPWAEIPRRLSGWLVRNTENFGYLVFCGGLIAILVYY